jgi:hypothetical protein
MLALAITGCVISGHKAFSTLFLEANAKHESLQIRAKAAQAIADEYQIILTADDSDMNRSRWERRQETADAAKLLEMKSKPPSEAIIYILLALFELVKIGGLYAIATPSSKGLTARQQRAKKRLEKIKDAQAEAEFERKLAAAIEQEDDANVVPLRAKN